MFPMKKALRGIQYSATSQIPFASTYGIRMSFTVSFVFRKAADICIILIYLFSSSKGAYVTVESAMLGTAFVTSSRSRRQIGLSRCPLVMERT